MTKFPLRVEGDVNDDLYLVAASVHEGVSRLTETTLEFACSNREVDLTPMLGKPYRAFLKDANGMERIFPGHCVSIEFAGYKGSIGHYIAELRPWLWFLGRTRECRVFNGEKSVPDLVKQILGDYGFAGFLEDKLNGIYEKREYIVQYRETDLDFISRLMEEEGMYYFFTDDGTKEKMVLADGVGSHEAIPAGNPVQFRPLDEQGRHFGWTIHQWSAGLAATSGKVSLADYNFEKPTALRPGMNQIPKGDHGNKDREFYDYPGHFREQALGGTRARVQMEAEAVRHKTASGAGNFSGLFIGKKFTMKDHGRPTENVEWMLTSATHRMQMEIPSDRAPPEGTGIAPMTDLAAGMEHDLYTCTFEAIPASEQYRAPLVTPWPEISGVHTALVVGKSGEEIHTDKYGRIAVQFHWDRLGKKDEKSSCWVRCMMPWTGKNWGMIAIPRIGQEVVVQFEEGDPDRPLVVGMLYNADTMPPYALPANMTQSGVKTNSSKGGGGFNELMMEDKKGKELVRFQSERDYKQIVKNNADITVGLEHKDKGDMTLEVHRHLTETVKTGNHAFTVAAGNQTEKIKKNKTETIEGKSTQTITGNVTETVKQGNVTRTLNMGNESTTLKMGNYSVETKLGKIEMTAMTGITLKCGASTITMTPASIEIKSVMVKVEGSAMVETKGAMNKVTGDALVMIKGGVTLIN